MLCGDLNGHISNGQSGILGNHFGVNPNGQRLIDFCARNKLKNMNTKKSPHNGKLKSFCKGIWTYEAQSTKTVVDYVLVSEHAGPMNKSMAIDDEKNESIQSDHNWIKVGINAGTTIYL